MSIKLVAVDIDGTLLNKREVTPEVFLLQQDAKAAGVKIVIATGRPIPGVRNLLRRVTPKRSQVTMSFTFNGGLVQDTSNREEYIKEPLSYEDIWTSNAQPQIRSSYARYHQGPYLYC